MVSIGKFTREAYYQFRSVCADLNKYNKGQRAKQKLHSGTEERGNVV